ncbi:hypothetical protein PINS_up015536 [Pythium insidiosum]|nr:hypothetical protein PINS_up015536 [Pythium insidiosum]
MRRRQWARCTDSDGNIMWRSRMGAEHSALLARFGSVTQPVEATEEPTGGSRDDDEESISIHIHECNEADRGSVASASVTATTTPDHSRSGDQAPTPSVDPTAPAFDNVTDAAAALASDFDRHPMWLAQPTDENAAHVVLLTDESKPVALRDLREIIRASELDFPTKIADFVARAAALPASPSISSIRLRIRRQHVINDTVETLSMAPSAHIRCPIRLTFPGEQGIDAGGVYREWFYLFCTQIVDTSAGVFRCVDAADQVFYLNPHSRHILGDNHLAHFFATGRFLGRALLEGNVTGFHLALPLLKIILGQPVSLSDLEFFDPETYRNLTWLLNNDGADALGLDFSVCEQVVVADGSTQTMVVDLIPNGRDVEVTDTNKALFVDRKFRYMVFESVSSQLYALLKGVYEVVPPEMLMLFDAEELDYVLSGSDEIDVDDWEHNSKWTFDLEDHPVRKWFWEIVRELPNEHRRRLLQFTTGSSRVPLAGFAALTSYDGFLSPFTLKGVDTSQDGNIRSHACFNRLDLPRYSTKQQLKMVLLAVLDSNAYGFTIE